VSHGKVWYEPDEPDGLPVLGDRGVVLAPLVKRDSQIAVGLGEVA